MLLVLASGTCVGILPFAVFRAVVQDWDIAILDFLIFVGMGIIFIYVYKTDNVKNTSLALISLALIGNVFSFYMKGISQIFWIYPAMLSAYYVMSPKKAMLVNFIMLSFYIPKLISILEFINITTILVTIIITNIIAYAFASGLRNRESILEKIASEDYLTTTGNRRALDETIKELHKKLKNHDKCASLILLDLDHFKKINDSKGHIVGDDILVRLSEHLLTYFDNKNQVFRFGGEEFLIICENKGINGAYKMAENIRKIVKKNIAVDNKKLTISLGVSEYIKEESIEDWVHRVDLALYQAKNQGRDKVVKM